MQPIHEVRAMWVVRNSIESPEKIAHLIATARDFGFNTLFVQVRGRGDAWYDSAIEPRAEELAREPATFDPLATVIEQAHAAGIQVHAWLNTLYVWSAGRAPYSSSHIVNEHPDWIARDTSGSFRTTAANQCEGAFLSPSNPDVRQHLHDVFLEVARNYDVDGIHFDYIRYPNVNYDYSPAAMDAFAKTIRPGLSPAEEQRLDTAGPRAYIRAYPARWSSWRRDQVTSLVEWISRDIKAEKPWVCISAAVFANSLDAYTNRGQDWKRWLKDGALDAVVPMSYSSNTSVVMQQIQDASDEARADGRACYAGLGAWRVSAQSASTKIEAARKAGAEGIVLFSYGGVTDDGATNNYLSKVDTWDFATPALQPQLSSVGVRPSAQQAQANVSGPSAAGGPAQNGPSGS